MIRKIIILLVLLIFLLSIVFKKEKLLNKTFYNYKDVYPFLGELKKKRYPIKKEVIKVINDDWKVWPEKYLFKNENGWKVFPFYAFGFWIKNNCEKCPVIHNIIKKIPGLRTASLSRLKPGTKLEPHYGWAKLSNYVLRCQYGIICGDNCILGCENDIVDVKENKIIVFDDSKLHYAQNNGKKDRIILILDIERPKNVEQGKSDVKDTSELTGFIKYMKMKNLKTE